MDENVTNLLKNIDFEVQGQWMPVWIYTKKIISNDTLHTEANSIDDVWLLIRSNGGQKIMEGHLWSALIHTPVNQNSVSGREAFKNGSEIRAFG